MGILSDYPVDWVISQEAEALLALLFHRLRASAAVVANRRHTVSQKRANCWGGIVCSHQSRRNEWSVEDSGG